MKRLFCFCLSVCIPLTAYSTPWYRIEMMLVHYNDAASIERENWPSALDPIVNDTVPRAITQLDWWLLTPKSNTLWNGFGTWPHPPAEWPAPLTTLDQLTLTSQAERINRRRDMDVIWHQAWIEPIQTEDQAIIHSIRIQPEHVPNIDIQGSVRFYLSRFLHIQTQLTVQHYDGIADTLQLNEEHNMSRETTAKHALQRDALATLSPQEHNIRIPVRAATVEYSRRMRSHELHYIDHPMLGIVVRITPIETVHDIDRQP